MTSSTFALIATASVLIHSATPTHADSTGFTGFYTPESWTITGAGIGGSSATFAADGSELELIGSDGGFGATVKATHMVLADGIWSFDWAWFGPIIGSPGFDAGYYTLNETRLLLSDAEGSATGTVRVPVTAGQSIGWQVVFVDGIFGAASLTITDFRAPVAAPAALALLGIAGISRRRRR